VSSLYVRELVKQWTGALAIPFYDTVNREQNPPERIWSTLVFVTTARAQADYCQGQHERGTFDFVVLSEAGGGDAGALAQAEAALAALMANKDPAGLLTLTQAGAFDEFPQPGAARWFTLSATVDYLYVT